jgi:hypothetical protein
MASTATRSSDPSGVDLQRVERALTDLLDSRRLVASVCPSEVARLLWPQGWRERMGTVHAAARSLARAGRLVVTQRGTVLDPGVPWSGPIRLRKPPG